MNGQLVRNLLYITAWTATFALGVGVVKMAIQTQNVAAIPIARSYPYIDRWKDFYAQREVKKEILEQRKEYKPICNDRQIKPLWNALHKNPEFLDRIDEMFEEHDCKDMFEIYRADLNRDGRQEILIRGAITEFCGGVGNCLFWVLEKRAKGYRLLIASSDYIDRSDMGDQIKKTTTNGYADLLLKGPFSAGETSFSYYKYDGRRYRESKCLYEMAVSYKGDEPVWGFITCKQFYRRIDEEIAGRRPR